jgi:DTW domain-containing protein YfiP
VVFLQHPRERRVAIGTARMAHLALPNSELHEGISFAGRAAIEALAADPSVAVLFPAGHTAAPAPATTPRTLIVVDGTWSQAYKLMRANPLLARLPRIALAPARPGNYRIRREPTPQCLATVEAVAAVLALLEDDRVRFDAMLDAFTFTVERQLACAAAQRAPRRRADRPGPRPTAPELAALLAAPEDVVLVHGEANAHGSAERAPGLPELLHLVAVRPARGERFEAFLAPRRPLGHRTALHLDVETDRLLGGEPVAPALARLEAFLGPRAFLCGWGPVAAELLAREGLVRHRRVDLRAVYARRLPGHPHGMDRAAESLGATAESPWAAGRAGRMIAWLGAVYAALPSAIAARGHVAPLGRQRSTAFPA